MDLAKSKQFDHLEGWMLFNKRDTIVTVKDVTEGQIDSFQTGGKIDKYMLHFEESSKTLPLNKTNLKTIIVLVGSTETDDWKGHRLALYSEWVKVGGKQVLGVRIRDTEPPPRQPTRREQKEKRTGPNEAPPMPEAQAVQAAMIPEPPPNNYQE